jgi:hypothetical protein
MNSIHRTGVAIAGLLAIAVMATAVFLQGGGSRDSVAQAAAADPATDAPTSSPTSLDTQTIYINPVPTPEVVRVVHTPPPAKRAKATQPVIHIIVPGPTGDDDGEGDD